MSWPPPNRFQRMGYRSPRDPHEGMSFNDRPCLKQWPAHNSWHDHLCIWGRTHLLVDHRCQCGQELHR